MIDGLPVVQLGPSAIAAAAVIMVLLGRLVPRAVVAVYLKRIESLESMNVTLLAQNSELMEMARLGQAMHRAIQEGASER